MKKSLFKKNFQKFPFQKQKNKIIFSKPKFLSKNIVSQKLSVKNKVFMMCAPDVRTCARPFHFETKNFKKFQNVELAVVTQRAVIISTKFVFSHLPTLIFIPFEWNVLFQWQNTENYQKQTVYFLQSLKVKTLF